MTKITRIIYRLFNRTLKIVNNIKSIYWGHRATFSAKFNGGSFRYSKAVFQVPVSCRSSRGEIIVSKNVTFGYRPAPMFGNGEILLQTRNKDATIHIGENCHFSNNVSVIACKKISIGSNLLCGANVRISDSDGHSINPDKRNLNGEPKEIVIGNNVWIGTNVVILKGVHIGDNSVIGTSSVVNKSIPENVVAAGIPAAKVKEIQ